MIFLLLFLLVVKHFIADFGLQSEHQVGQKGKYGASGGIEHAMVHAVLTTIVLAAFVEFPHVAIMLGIFDGLVHYHIDYIKARFGSRDANTKLFWFQLGLDQMCHYIFYIWLVWVLNDLL
jgi:hypothetical protein